MQKLLNKLAISEATREFKSIRLNGFYFEDSFKNIPSSFFSGNQYFRYSFAMRFSLFANFTFKQSI